MDVALGKICRVLDDNTRVCLDPTDEQLRGAVVLVRETRDEIFLLLTKCKDWGKTNRESVSELVKRNSVLNELQH
jgi:hypothetical protein